VRGSGTLPALEDFITSGQRYTRQVRQPLHTLVQNFWNVPRAKPNKLFDDRIIDDFQSALKKALDASG
jgi:hypothetical protein